MKFLVRFGWFLFTATIYYFIDSAFQAADTNSFIRLMVFLVYTLFVYVVPSNAFIAMLDKKKSSSRPSFDRSKSCFLMCMDLSKHLYQVSDSFLRETNLPSNVSYLVCMWCALFVSLKDHITPEIVKYMDQCFRSTFSGHSPTITNNFDPIILLRDDVMRSLASDEKASSDEFLKSCFHVVLYHSGYDFDNSPEVDPSMVSLFIQTTRSVQAYYLNNFSSVLNVV